jgi:NAD+ synthase (glutamine-hydrolysing)
MEVLPGRPAENATGMLAQIGGARRDGVRLLVFPEMAISGYLIGDEWEHESFLRECEACRDELVAASRGLVVVFGGVGVDWTRRNEDGRVRKYNALFVAEDGALRGPDGSPYPFVVKALLPNYREFDDSRHFFDLRKLALERGCPVEDLVRPVRAGGLSIGCLLCEDAWDMDYALSPLDLLAQTGIDLLVNVSASPFTVNKRRKRERVFRRHLTRSPRPLLYVNNVGIQNNGKTVFTFDGSSCVYDGRGNSVRCGTPFAPEVLTVDVPLSGAPFGAPVAVEDDTIAEIHQAIEYGTRRFMDQCGVRRVVIGVSGGVDSAVVAAVYRRLLDPGDLLLVNMPSRHNSSTTRGLALAVARNLGCLYAELPIEESVAVTRRQIDGLVARSIDGAVEQRLALSEAMLENVQARDRGSRLLAALSAAFGGVFTCNANKSEATVGYTTLYGDLCGYLANIADLWKMEVYDVARHLNRSVYGRDVIPAGVLALTPSAELSPAQNVDEGKGDPLAYRYHDALFRSWVEEWNRATPEENLEWYAAGLLEEKLGFAGTVSELFPDARAFVADLERWWNQYQGMGLAKRIQAPPVLAVKRRAFGFDHRESQMGPVYTRRYRETKERLLGHGVRP